MPAGLWLGFKLYGKLDDAAFRKVILSLLLVAGVTFGRAVLAADTGGGARLVRRGGFVSVTVGERTAATT